MTFLRLADWYPAMDRLWRREGQRLWVATSARRGWMVHHTDGSFGSWLDYARWVADFHYHTRGWRRPGGYNFFIPRTPPDGLALEMCGLNFIGAHAANHNTDEVGVAFEGNFATAMPNTAQLDCFARLVSSIDIPGRQRRHRDVSATSCPGARLAAAVPLPITPSTPPEEPDMPLDDETKRWLRANLSTHQPRDIWTFRNPQTGQSYGFHSRRTMDDSRQTVELLTSVLEAVGAGLDTQAILAKIDQRADQKVALLEDIAELVADSQARDAQAVVDAIRDRLAGT